MVSPTKRWLVATITAVLAAVAGCSAITGGSAPAHPAHPAREALPPVMAAATKASWMRIYAEKESLNLSDCYSYSDSMSDLPMLSVVGHPTAVNPDLRLRNTALQHDWPILDLR